MHKSSKISVALRQEGNDLYKERHFFQALLKYNQSLCFAETNSESLGLAFANRSAVYLEMKMFDKSLKNIDLAVENYYPKENVEILKARRTKCMELMKNCHVKNSDFIFKMSMPKNKKLPFLANCLKLKCDENFGRHIITTEHLSVGDVIAVDEPFCCVTISESNFVNVPEFNIYQRCNKCLKHNHLDLFPCRICCHAMFCSEECHKFAMKYYHRYECPIIVEMSKSGSVNMSLRIFFMSLSLFDGDINKLKCFYEENVKNPKNIFDFDFSSLSTSDKNLHQLKCLLGLSKSSMDFPISQQKSILTNHTELCSIYKDNSDFIDKFIQHQCQISSHNFHGIFSSNLSIQSFDVTNLKSLQEPIGSGSFLFASLINHSCTPNILRICIDAKIYIVVCRRIEKGYQIFDCYKNNFMMESKDRRQTILKKEFDFSCNCEACSNDWPIFKQQAIKDIKLMKYAKKLNDNLNGSFKNHSLLFKNFKDCKKILHDYHQNYPSMELCVIQKTLATFLLKLAAQHNFHS